MTRKRAVGSNQYKTRAGSSADVSSGVPDLLAQARNASYDAQQVYLQTRSTEVAVACRRVFPTAARISMAPSCYDPNVPHIATIWGPDNQVLAQAPVDQYGEVEEPLDLGDLGAVAEAFAEEFLNDGDDRTAPSWQGDIILPAT